MLVCVFVSVYNLRVNLSVSVSVECKCECAILDTGACVHTCLHPLTSGTCTVTKHETGVAAWEGHSSVNITIRPCLQ